MKNGVKLREVTARDLPIFYKNEADPVSVEMAAFTREDPSDREAFNAHWKKILKDESVYIQTIILKDQVVGSIFSYFLIDELQVSYWIGKEYWGRGIATESLILFLQIQKIRPIYARAAKDNLGSIRVLQKCGFIITGQDNFHANARGKEIEELILQLK